MDGTIKNSTIGSQDIKRLSREELDSVLRPESAIRVTEFQIAPKVLGLEEILKDHPHVTIKQIPDYKKKTI